MECALVAPFVYTPLFLIYFLCVNHESAIFVDMALEIAVRSLLRGQPFVYGEQVLP